MTPAFRRKIIVAATVVAAAVVIAIYASFDPESAFFPACPIKSLTGFDCPGCGSQRAFHAILNGRFGDAWRYNAVLFILMPVAVVMCIAELTRDRHPLFYRRMTSRQAVIAVIAVIVLWTVTRNLF